MSAQQTSHYRKHFIPLESNPQVFTTLLRDLGAKKSLSFTDVWSLDDIETLSPSPLAYVFLFHTGSTYEGNELGDDSMWEEIDKSSTTHVLWLKQTIHNACGLYAMLHAVLNGEARECIETGSTLDSFLKECEPLTAKQRALALEGSTEIAEKYAKVASGGETLAPSNAEDEVDYHFVAFVRSLTDQHVYELDGDRKHPIDRGTLSDGVNLSSHIVPIVKSYMALESAQLGFSLMALIREDNV